MAWRLPQILIAMVTVLVLGLCSVWFMELRMGGATVPGLVLIEAPFAAAETLAAALSGEGAMLGRCDTAGEPFEPFGQAVLERLRDRGDTLVLYVPGGEGDPVDHAAASPAWSSILPAMRPEDDGPAERAASLLAASQQISGFCIGLVLEADAELATDVVPQLLDAMGELPEFRRVSLVVLGAAVADDPSRRHFLRIDRGPWKGRNAGDLEDLLEAGW